jgi:PAS domain-containing protein
MIRHATLAPRMTREPEEPRAALSCVLAAHQVDAPTVDAMIERLPVGIAVTDRDGRLVYANAAARALPLSEIPAVQNTVAQALLTGAEMREESREFRGGGRSRRWLTVTAAPVRGADGHAGAALVTLEDVTAALEAGEWRPVIDSLVSL